VLDPSNAYCPAIHAFGVLAFVDGHATNTATEIDCELGEYSPSGLSVCTVCPAGYACPNIYDDYKVLCEPGYYALAKAHECTACPAGEEWTNSTNSLTSYGICTSSTSY
jgi:hypothetical protein